MQNSDRQGRIIIIDTYAWIEYFKGSEEGEKAKRFIEGQFELCTPSIVIAELSDKYRRERIMDWDARNRFIKLKTKILSLDENIADKAGALKQNLRKTYKDTGLADAIILAHSIDKNGSILTGDKHLRNSNNAIDLSIR